MEKLAFRLDLYALSTPTARVVKRLSHAIVELLEEEQAKGFHAYGRYTNWPLIRQLLEANDAKGERK